MNRLTNATAPVPVPNQPAGGSGALAYGYDWVGNRIHPPSGANPMVYNKADQLTSWPGMRQYTYYGDGSLHHVLNAGGTSTLSSYTYTPTGLLATANYGNSRTLTNTWDENAQRVGMSVEDHDYSFVYDAGTRIPAVIEEVNAGTTSTTTTYYFREPGGALISRVEGANTSYYHFDALGSTRLLTDASENVTDKYAYDAYGSLISHDRTEDSADQPYQYVGRLGYYTHYQEPDFRLLQLGVRFYDPEVGRFTQRDVFAFLNSGQAYDYANEAPLYYSDATGMYVEYDPGRAQVLFERWRKNYDDNVICNVSTSHRTIMRRKFSIGAFTSCLRKELSLLEAAALLLQVVKCSPLLLNAPYDGGASFIQCMTESPDWVDNAATCLSCADAATTKKKVKQAKYTYQCRTCTNPVWYQGSTGWEDE